MLHLDIAFAWERAGHSTNNANKQQVTSIDSSDSEDFMLGLTELSDFPRVVEVTSPIPEHWRASPRLARIHDEWIGQT